MPVRSISSILLVSACLIFAACSPGTDQAPSPHAAQPTVQEAGSKAAVAMPDKYGAQVSEDILRAGGNAVDAAIAAGFGLAVTYPEAGNIGGGGFMLIHIDGQATFLDYRETAPLAAHRDMYLDEQGDVIEKTSLIGIKAAGVPGTVAGLWAARPFSLPYSRRS